jgi:hypothetical protein
LVAISVRCAAAIPHDRFYALIALDGEVIVRAIVAGDDCPTAAVDGRSVNLTLRLAPHQFPPRLSASGSAEALPQCEGNCRRIQPSP